MLFVAVMPRLCLSNPIIREPPWSACLMLLSLHVLSNHNILEAMYEGGESVRMIKLKPKNYWLLTCT